MVDFNELKNKAQAFAAEHAEQVKDGITKAGDFVGKKIGDDKVNPVEEKLHGLVDKAAGKDDLPPPPPPVVPPTAV